jgi:tripartite-type tricarboxylate transporter receptor subunit TctC
VVKSEIMLKEKIMRRRLARNALLVLALTSFGSSQTVAQDYPSRAITIVVPLAAGTGMDIIARLYGEQLSRSLSKPVIVENKPGAGFIVATQSVLAAPADGHTLLIGAPGNLAYNHILYKRLPFDPEKDLVPISHYLTSPFILVVNPVMPVQSVSEFIQYAKERATPLSYSTPAGVGIPHFAVEVFKQRFGLRLTHVPYRNSPQSILDIASGHVDFAFAEAGASQALIRDGKLRALAVSSRQRLPAHPSIPPFAEVSGVADYEVVAWHILAARAGTPEPILQRLNAEMKRIMGAPEMQKRIANMGLIPLDPAPLAETDHFIKSETVKWRTLLTAIGLVGTL